MTTDGIVLVHGGMHTAGCWASLLPLLDRPARAVDLPGRGSRPADLDTVTLSDCVEAVLDEVGAAGFDRFSLVGHSLGGVTITETGYRYPQRVTHLVYVGALVPAPDSNASIIMTGGDLESMGTIPAEMARSLFGNDLSDERWADHVNGMVPEAVGIMNARVSGYPSGIPTTYVNMSQDVAVPPSLAEEMVANLGSGVVRRRIDAGHSVMVSQPELLAGIIDEAVAR